MQVRNIIDKLYNTTNASREELLFLLDNLSYENKEYLIEKAHEVAIKSYGKNVYIINFYKEIQKHKDYLMADGIHLTEKGNARLNELINEILK